MLSLGLGLGSREEIRAGWPLLPSSGRSSPSGGSSRGVGGAVGVAPRLSGRSSPGGGCSLGETSSALGGPGGITSFLRAWSFWFCQIVLVHFLEHPWLATQLLEHQVERQWFALQPRCAWHLV